MENALLQRLIDLILIREKSHDDRHEIACPFSDPMNLVHGILRLVSLSIVVAKVIRHPCSLNGEILFGKIVTLFPNESAGGYSRPVQQQSGQIAVIVKEDLELDKGACCSVPADPMSENRRALIARRW